jgi:hypothetical protein
MGDRQSPASIAAAQAILAAVAEGHTTPQQIHIETGLPREVIRYQLLRMSASGELIPCTRDGIHLPFYLTPELAHTTGATPQEPPDRDAREFGIQRTRTARGTTLVRFGDRHHTTPALTARAGPGFCRFSPLINIGD